MTEKKVYSFSRINGFSLAEKGEGCFYNWYKTYIENDRGENNYFGEYGTFFHETVESIHNGDLLAWDMSQHIKNGLRNIKYKAPFPAMGKSYEAAMHSFFDDGSYDEIFDQYEVLEAEDEKLFSVGEVQVKGFPDLVANHKKYGFVIADYKTAKKYEGDKLDHNLMQLYLYSIPIKEKYGRHPDHLVYIYPREKGQKEFAYPFELEKLESTKIWVIETVRKIESHADWSPRCNESNRDSDFFANHLCNHRNTCHHKNVEKVNPFANLDDDEDWFS